MFTIYSTDSHQLTIPVTGQQCTAAEVEDFKQRLERKDVTGEDMERIGLSNASSMGNKSLEGRT